MKTAQIYSKHNAFTLIEVLISILILSTSLIVVLSTHTDVIEEIMFLEDKNISKFNNTLFLKNTIVDGKNTGYDVLKRDFPKLKDIDIKVLKGITKDIKNTNIETLKAERQPVNPTFKNNILTDDFKSTFIRIEI